MKTIQNIRIRTLIICFGIFAICQGSLANSKNLAYEDDFAWYLAGRLTTQFFELKTTKNQDATAGEIASLRMDMEFIYHHLVMECNGPLPTLAPVLKFFELSKQNDKRYASALVFVGKMDSEIWPIVTLWEKNVRSKALEMLKSGSFTGFPKCVTPGFREQNTIP